MASKGSHARLFILIVLVAHVVEGSWRWPHDQTQNSEKVTHKTKRESEVITNYSKVKIDKPDLLEKLENTLNKDKDAEQKSTVASRKNSGRNLEISDDLMQELGNEVSLADDNFLQYETLTNATDNPNTTLDADGNEEIPQSRIFGTIKERLCGVGIGKCAKEDTVDKADKKSDYEHEEVYHVKYVQPVLVKPIGDPIPILQSNEKDKGYGGSSLDDIKGDFINKVHGFKSAIIGKAEYLFDKASSLFSKGGYDKGYDKGSKGKGGYGKGSKGSKGGYGGGGGHDDYDDDGYGGSIMTYGDGGVMFSDGYGNSGSFLGSNTGMSSYSSLRGDTGTNVFIAAVPATGYSLPSFLDNSGGAYGGPQANGGYSVGSGLANMGNGGYGGRPGSGGGGYTSGIVLDAGYSGGDGPIGGYTGGAGGSPVGGGPIGGYTGGAGGGPVGGGPIGGYTGGAGGGPVSGGSIGGYTGGAGGGPVGGYTGGAGGGPVGGGPIGGYTGGAGGGPIGGGPIGGYADGAGAALGVGSGLPSVHHTHFHNHNYRLEDSGNSVGSSSYSNVGGDFNAPQRTISGPHDVNVISGSSNSHVATHLDGKSLFQRDVSNIIIPNNREQFIIQHSDNFNRIPMPPTKQNNPNGCTCVGKKHCPNHLIVQNPFLREEVRTMQDPRNSVLSSEESVFADDVAREIHVDQVVGSSRLPSRHRREASKVPDVVIGKQKVAPFVPSERDPVDYDPLEVAETVQIPVLTSGYLNNVRLSRVVGKSYVRRAKRDVKSTDEVKASAPEKVTGSSRQTSSNDDDTKAQDDDDGEDDGIVQRFFNNLVGGFGSGLDGLKAPPIAPAFGVTFGSLPNTVQTPFGGGGGLYGDNNPLGIDIGPVSINPFVGFRFQKQGKGKKKVFVPSFDILVTPNAKGTKALSKIKKKIKHNVRDAPYDDGFYYDDAIPIQTLPYQPGLPVYPEYPSYPPQPYHHQPQPYSPQVYHHESPTYAPQHYHQPQPYAPQPYAPQPYHDTPQPYQLPYDPSHGVQQVAPPSYHQPPTVIHHPPPQPEHLPYPPTGPYLPDQYQGNPAVHATSHPSNSPFKHTSDGVKLHHHVHEHTHVHKGLGSTSPVGHFRENSYEREGILTNIEHLGRHFRENVPTNIPSHPPAQDTFRIKNNNAGPNNAQRFTFENFRPNSPSNTFTVSQTNPSSRQGAFKFPTS